MEDRKRWNERRGKDKFLIEIMMMREQATGHWAVGTPGYDHTRDYRSSGYKEMVNYYRHQNKIAM